MGVIENNEFGTPIAGYPLYAQILDILGSTGTIIPIGDAAQENSARTTCTTLGSQQVVFTYSEAVTSFDTPPTITGPGRIPLITFNGTDEEADSPDANYWSRDDSSGQGFSIGVWVAPTTGSAIRVFAKGGEWWLTVEPGGTYRLALRDNSEAINISRVGSTTLTSGQRVFMVATYDGSGGAAAADTINMYLNGGLDNGSATNNAGYAAMENRGTTLTLGSGTAADYLTGSLTGGPLGSFFTEIELTSANVTRLYNIGKSALGI